MGLNVGPKWYSFDWRGRGGSNGRSAESFRFVEPVTDSGELGGISRRGLVAERGRGPHSTVIGRPGGDDASGMVEAEEQCLFSELVPHLRVEAFADTVLHRLARYNEEPWYARLLAQGQHRVRSELDSVVTDGRAEPATPGDQRRQFPPHSTARDRVDCSKRGFTRGPSDGQTAG